MTGSIEAPFGSWSSPIGADALLHFDVSIGEVVVDGDVIWFAVPRPQEGGRTAIMARYGAEVVEMSPPGANVRTRVHEYGGGAWWVHDDELWWVEADDQRLRRLDCSTPDAEPVMLTAPSDPVASHRYADGRPDTTGAWYVCVREVHHLDGVVTNDLVAVAGDGSTRVAVLACGADFYSSPRLSPDGTSLVWLQWNHPSMPWDATELWIADYDAGSIANERRLVGPTSGDIGDPPIAPQQPMWGPDGSLFVVADFGDWWNLYRWDASSVVSASADDRPHPVAVGDFEIGTPPWVFGRPRVAVSGDFVFYAATSNGADELVALGEENTSRSSLDQFLSIASLDVTNDGAVVFVATTAVSNGAIFSWRPHVDPEPTLVWSGPDIPFDAAFFPRPEPLTFATTGDEVAHALWYQPASPDRTGPTGQRPPLIVRAHGGPTSDTRRGARVDLRFWTSRGFGVVDVLYRGSTGYGRAYREALAGQWGVVDVDDCIAAAEFLSERGDVDPNRIAIAGSSAGGFTVLAAIERGDLFSAGALRYGVTDLQALVGDTHKFEARYPDSLIAPWPEGQAVYVERSPINHLDKISCPLLVQQGGQDRVVPPSQAEALVAGLDRRRVPWAYVLYPDEAHGFRSAETIVAAVEAEAAFLTAVWRLPDVDGFTTPPLHHFER